MGLALGWVKPEQGWIGNDAAFAPVARLEHDQRRHARAESLRVGMTESPGVFCDVTITEAIVVRSEGGVSSERSGNGGVLSRLWL